MFDINKFKNISPAERYRKQIDRLMSNRKDTTSIENTITISLNNIKNGITSFIVYGEPQSGKTEMMISLTAKLLDEGNKVIIILLNDNDELLKQNLNRFIRSGIDPAPKNFTEVISPEVKIEEREWIIFCKKNSRCLDKLINKIQSVKQKVIIDDEADYATPNAKVNKQEKTRINQLVGELLGEKGVYIGVTATPARLDLNNTFENANDRWVNFPPHQLYTGQDKFFPIDLNRPLEYILEALPDHNDDPKYLREALFRFFVRVAYLNLFINSKGNNYCMLIHTSGKRVDHSEDYKQVVTIFNVLKDQNAKDYNQYVKTIWDIAKKLYDEEKADKITQYICEKIGQYVIVVMNSDTDRKNIDYSNATLPCAIFTIAIGGNIVSRGVTFENLLSMFFTRDVKHKIQQDTYIQRARMFGNRGETLQYFELAIPERLYLDWHKCFVFHRLALESIRSGNAPVWLEDNRVRAVSPSSIDKTTVSMDSGEMSFEIFDYTDEVEQIIDNERWGSIDKLKKLYEKLGVSKLPNYLISFIENFSLDGENSLAIHGSTDISDRGADVDKERIERTRGFIGKSEQEEVKYPHAIHHIKIFYNSKKKGRIFYRYVGNIKFIKNLRKSKI